MTQPLFGGVAVALVTLFDDALAVDNAATAAHAACLVDEGVQAVLVAGTTGEADALTDSERATLTAAVRAAVPDSIPVIAGTSGIWAASAASRARDAVSAGADALLVAPPRRVGDIGAYYAAVADAAGSVPVLAYHFPGTAGGDVPVEALPDLPVAGIKDSTGDAERLLRELAVWSGATYVGASTLTFLAGALGAAGAILAIANSHPAEAAAAFRGDAEAQRALIEPHLTAKARFPHELKAMIAKRYGTATYARIG